MLISRPLERSVYEFDYVVAPGDSASRLSLLDGDEFPDVLATSRMIALMEVAAARLLGPHLQTGAITVGVGVEVTHLAPTRIGQTVRLRAEYVGIAASLHEFIVTASDQAGTVGSGRHTRAIIALSRFMVGAQNRIDKQNHLA